MIPTVGLVSTLQLQRRQGEKERVDQEPALPLLATGGGPKHILVKVRVREAVGN